MTVPSHPLAKVLASCSALEAPAWSSRGGSTASSSETPSEIHRINKRAIRELNRANLEGRIVTVTTTLPPIKKPTIRFSDPLVTQVTHRPWTLDADIEELYFCMEELDEMEWDRETTQADQYECIVQEQSPLSSVANVAIAHKMKRCEEPADDDVAVVPDIQSFCSTDTEFVHYFDRSDEVHL
jgi:hypothetical protein